MRFSPLPIAGAWLVEIDPARDERGFFARTFAGREFVERGLVSDFAERSISYNAKKGTLRGLHYQVSPFGETKIVRCTRGAIFDVLVDLRSPNAGKHYGVELTEQNRRMLYIPEGCAHGFLTLADETEVYYEIAGEYRPEAARGIRWDDPVLAIGWPFPPTLVGQRDNSLPTFREALLQSVK